jgi:hypothetical protein
VLDDGEACDTGIAAGAGRCPAACADDDPCTVDALSGEGCGTTCTHDVIALHIGGDGCCPAGATSKSDADCAVACGNGIVEEGEFCDTGISGGPGTCPSVADCDDHITCTADAIVESRAGVACTARCEHQPITGAGIADGCCPAGATTATDPDCSASCGNGVVDGNETCDTKISGAAGACPTAAECDDADPCTADQLVSGGTCSATCLHTPISGKQHGDGCCAAPDVTPPSEDSDCPPLTAYGSCDSDADCSSQKCVAFAALQGGKVCTAQCTENLIDIRGGCPTSTSDTLPVCVSYADAAKARQATCLLTRFDSYVAADSDGGFITAGDTVPGSIQASDDVDLFFLGGATWDTNVKVIVKPELGFDPLILTYDLDLTLLGWVNNGGKSQEETAFVLVPSVDVRRYFAVTAASGTGSYTVTVDVEQ